MRKPSPLALFCCCAPFLGPAGAADLTAEEIRWLKAAAPVLAYSQTLQLPVDITVQPQARPNDVALAMGFADGRCKLVLSLRGNPHAGEVFVGVPHDQQDVLIETMAAHEIGHCWRYARHDWHAVPAGFVPMGTVVAERREEAWADLAALAWVQLRHPGQYRQVYRWMGALRASTPLSGGSHDTRDWLDLADDPRRFGDITQPFADVDALWRAGLARGQ